MTDSDAGREYQRIRRVVQALIRSLRQAVSLLEDIEKEEYREN